MKDTETVTLDEILTEYGARRASKYYKFKVGESEDYDGEAERLKSEAKAAITKLIESVIGEDGSGSMANALRAEQRQRLQALSNSGKAGE